MIFNIYYNENATNLLDTLKLAECAMIIAAKRHDIKLGINNMPYYHLGHINQTHYNYFIRKITEECNKQQLTPPNLTGSDTIFDLSWIDESPETLRFVKAAFRKPETLISTLQFTKITGSNIKNSIPTPPELGKFPAVVQFIKCRRQFIKLDGINSNLELIATNLLSLTLSPFDIVNIITLIKQGLHLKNDADPVAKALGISTPMSAVIAWADKQGFESSLISHIESTIEVNKAVLGNIAKRYCIDVIKNHKQQSFKDSIEIAKKIRNYYHNSKKILDGRSVTDNSPITVILSKDIYEKLENHKKVTKITHTELIESLLIKHFENINSKKAAKKRKSPTINNTQESGTLSSMAPVKKIEVDWISPMVQAMQADD